eukprot:TRINITY_DN9575_c0_g1_i7.p1 TRINITY_DN9575_c0_g1~~TRINITY_DN9575_c0_g1_i7.p1  ORF type:complete len:108 (+),score=15.37 TRINITY_DN9575_c0_g1_i7:280-603(+)
MHIVHPSLAGEVQNNYQDYFLVDDEFHLPSSVASLLFVSCGFYFLLLMAFCPCWIVSHVKQYRKEYSTGHSVLSHLFTVVPLFCCTTDQLLDQYHQVVFKLFQKEKT